MNYTAQQKREIFYQAAANIEARPDLYNFFETKVGDPGCPACMWGHVGRVMGLPHYMINTEVAEKACADGTACLYLERHNHEDPNIPAHAAAVLRRFADKYWPAEQEAMSFGDLMASLAGEKA